MKLKELEFNDVFELSKILKNLKIELSKEELDRLGNDGIKAGIQLFLNIIGNLQSSKKEINTFLGHLFGISGDEFGKLGIKDTTNCLKEFNELKKTGEFKDFLDAVGQLMS